MDEHKRRCLALMDIPVWIRRDRGAGATVAAAEDAAGPGAPARDPSSELAAMAEEVAGCTRCALHHGRTRAVFGVGDPRAQLMVVGEAPGADEDRQGKPFVGRAGRLLDAMLRAIGLERDGVYITNIVKCRPPSNRDPRPEEAAACQAFLRRQIELIAPRVILAVGRVAAQNLLETTASVGSLRGQRLSYEATESPIPVVVTYHPAYLLRTPVQKRRAWDDLRAARALLAE
ncbi:MAG: uracil-DNA glycosylase [Gammaproteobacteria bacterium]|nr:uracil-DNA glycosylase [Gammaproteobacteria bacterium]NIR84277.1 uracil-DNA glycosylase [Gammaproteobacteria bacterium]NIR89747.1 uracil-DNA glycosylase [Gammaproteobacteria bacterium]NIU05435.1 uracil-DNA glycosylase [Gammaproteobacteria bacterium]NIV52381.1 uracil-DNA glycosylase [Gammaproteobacteria bacterium]